MADPFSVNTRGWTGSSGTALTELFRTLLCFALLRERLAGLVYTYKFSNLGDMALKLGSARLHI